MNDSRYVKFKKSKRVFDWIITKYILNDDTEVTVRQKYRQNFDNPKQPKTKNKTYRMRFINQS